MKARPDGQGGFDISTQNGDLKATSDGSGGFDISSTGTGVGIGVGGIFLGIPFLILSGLVLGVFLILYFIAPGVMVSGVIIQWLYNDKVFFLEQPVRVMLTSLPIGFLVNVIFIRLIYKINLPISIIISFLGFLAVGVAILSIVPNTGFLLPILLANAIGVIALYIGLKSKR